MLIDTISLALFSHTDEWQANGQMYLHEGFFMLRNFTLHDKQFLIPTQPYLVQEGRVVLVTGGEACYSFNLVERRFVAGDLVVFGGDTLVEKRFHSADFQFTAFNFHITNDTLRFFSSYRCIHLTDESRSVVDGHMNLMWQLLQQPVFPRENIRLLTRSLLQYVCTIKVDEADGAASNDLPLSRHDGMMRRFADLVSRHAVEERSVAFYAGELCVAPHYLSTLIKQLSGRTVKQWVNQVLIKEIKVWLAYSDESINEISYRLNFPCAVSLTKFFKRETGSTPSEYRLHKLTG